MLQLRTFGAVQVADSTGEPLGGAAAQRRLLALLALLATAGSGGISRDRLLGILWTESDTERARRALAQALYHARRTLDCDDLVIGRDDLRLNRQRMTVDVWALEEAVESNALERAAAIYRGPFLDGFFLTGAAEFEQWAAGQRTRYEMKIADVLDRLATAAEAQRDHGAAVEWRRRRAAIDPLDTRAALQLMTTLAAAGDRTGALQHARVHEVLVRERLDLPPDTSVTRLAATIRAQAEQSLSTVFALPDSASASADLGERRDPAHLPPAGFTPVAANDDRPDVPSASPRPKEYSSASHVRGPAARSVGRIALAAAGGLVLAALGIREMDRGATRSAVPARAPVDSQPVVIAPFRVAGADPSLAFLREGMVELLSTRLLSDSGSRLIDPGAVLGAWRAAGLTTIDDVPRARAVQVAGELGASRLVSGSVVGNPGRVVITASVVAVPGGHLLADATVEGKADSLSSLIDRLAAELVALEAGERHRLARHRLPPLPALRAYLDGQAEYRQGDYTGAMQHYERALRLDTSFAIAALRLALAADRVNDAEQHDRAVGLAWAARAELSAPDSAHLVAFAGPRYPAPSPETEQLAAWQRAVTFAPDRAEVWYELGERYFHDGALLGLRDARDRARAALARALDLDPSHTTARRLLVLLAARAGDTVTLGQVATVAALRDSMGDLGPFVRWRVALVRNDSLELQRLRAEMPGLSRSNLRAIAMASQFDAIGTEDGARATRILRVARSPRASDQLDALLAEHSFALSNGRPVHALDVTEQVQDAQPGWRAHLRLRILDAIYADGAADIDVAEEAAEQLSIRVSRGPESSPTAEAIRLADACVVAQWRLAHGETRGVRQIITALRGAGVPGVTVPVGTSPIMCAELVDATLAVVTRHPEALQQLGRLDSLMLGGPAVGDAGTYAPLAVARLYERLGVPERALAALRRRRYMAGWPRYLSTIRRHEGELALRLGDPATALATFRRYLALLDDPEERVRPYVSAVRAEVARLEREP